MKIIISYCIYEDRSIINFFGHIIAEGNLIKISLYVKLV